MSRTHTHGIVEHDSTVDRRTDYLYRISLKCLVRDRQGKVLAVKESGRDRWDLPGGGMDHGESIKLAIAREMKEEANLTGDFRYRILAVDEPKRLDELQFWQLRLIFLVEPETMSFSAGADSDEVAFLAPEAFKDSSIVVERRIYEYSQLVCDPIVVP